MSKYKSLSVQDLIDDQVGGAIFVLNTSDTITRGGDVFITVPVGNTNRPVKIPRTWIPIELTKTLPRKAILESVYFMEAASRGLIQIITREDAKKIEGRSGFASEVQRLKDREDAVKLEGIAKGIGKNVTVVSPNGSDDEERPAPKVAVTGKKGVSIVSLEDDDSDGDEDEPTVSPTFVAWANKINMIEDGAKAWAEFKLKGSFEYEECLYLIDNCNHGKIKRYLSKKLED